MFSLETNFFGKRSEMDQILLRTILLVKMSHIQLNLDFLL